MNELVKAVKTYLLDILGIKAPIATWRRGKELPFFLRDFYEFCEATLLKQPCVFIIVKHDEEATAGTLKKHLKEIQKKAKGICIFVQRTATSYNRKRYIEQRIPFIIPGNQMFLPELGIDLREHFKPIKMEKQKFRPATQAVLIHVLVTQKSEGYTPTELSSVLGYTPMSMSRVFDELEKAKIGKVFRRGKERVFLCEDKMKDLWEQVRPYLRSPVKKRIWARGKRPKNQAGFSALAKRSMLAPSSVPVYAISFQDSKDLDFSEFPDQEEAAFQFEIWHYDPNLFAKKGVVDPFSLYLSLHEMGDERVEAALEEMMGDLKW